MTISELIERLEEFRQKHGDLAVHTDYGYGRVVVRRPILAHEKVLTGRQSREAFAFKDFHRGDPVCKL